MKSIKNQKTIYKIKKLEILIKIKIQNLMMFSFDDKNKMVMGEHTEEKPSEQRFINQPCCAARNHGQVKLTSGQHTRQ